MFAGSADELKQTKSNATSRILHSVILAKTLTDFNPQMVAGHSQEFSALVANQTLSLKMHLNWFQTYNAKKRAKLLLQPWRQF
jgi:[acyl-carrier-protein] S-malonyltransferase